MHLDCQELVPDGVTGQHSGALLFDAIVTAPTPTPLTGITGQMLQQQPEGQLRYPGVSVRSTYAGDQHLGMGTRRGGITTASFASPDDQAAIVRWYTTQLAGHGWSGPGTGPAVSIYPTQPTFTWSKPGYTFRLTFELNAASATAGPATPTGGTTIYSTLLEVIP